MAEALPMQYNFTLTTLHLYRNSIGNSRGSALATALPIPYDHLDVVMGLIPTKDRTPSCDSMARQRRCTVWVAGFGGKSPQGGGDNPIRYHSVSIVSTLRRDAAVRAGSVPTVISALWEILGKLLRDLRSFFGSKRLWKKAPLAFSIPVEWK
jgi:hypothetical protein